MNTEGEKSLGTGMETTSMQKTAAGSASRGGGDQGPGGLKLQIKPHKEEAAVT